MSVRWTFLIPIGIAFAGAFSGLDASSFWLDELFTAYFADPHQENVWDMWTRASEDVHPPVYYTLLYFFAKSGEDFVKLSRAFSAIFSIIAVAILYFSFPKNTNPTARLFACAFAATSTLWYLMAQEARSYGLVFVFSSLMALLGLKLLDQLRGKYLRVEYLFLFWVIGVLGALTHFYLVLLSGGIIAGLIVFSRSWRQSLMLTSCGLAILPPILIYMDWHRDRIVGNVAHMWFSNEPIFFLNQALLGLRSLAGSETGMLFILISLSLFVYTYLTSSRTPSLQDSCLSISFLLLSSTFSVLFSLMISITFQPHFSMRVFYVFAPLVWIIIGITIDAASRAPMVARLMWIFPLLFTAVAVIQFDARRLPLKQEWRASANFIESLPACSDSAIPAVQLDQKYISGDEAGRFYGFYLNQPERLKILPVPRDRPQQTLERAPVSDIVRSRLLGTDPCPVLLWSVHHLTREQISAISSWMTSQFPIADRAALKVVDFAPRRRHSFLQRMIIPPFPIQAFVLTVDRQPDAAID